jgi:hypothetical protein
MEVNAQRVGNKMKKTASTEATECSLDVQDAKRDILVRYLRRFRYSEKGRRRHGSMLWPAADSGLNICTVRGGTVAGGTLLLKMASRANAARGSTPEAAPPDM